MKKIGIFGGSFNPIHKHHIIIAESVLSTFKLEKILFIPANISPLKPAEELENSKHRLKMLELALEEHTQLSISTFELRKGGISYTIDTVKHFLNSDPKSTFYLIMGEDSFETIKSWNSYEKILKTLSIIVYPRARASIKKALLSFPSFKFIQKANSGLEEYNTFSPHHLYYMDFPLLSGSASDIRNNINDLSSRKELVPPKVLEYINKNKLFTKQSPI